MKIVCKIVLEVLKKRSKGHFSTQFAQICLDFGLMRVLYKALHRLLLVKNGPLSLYKKRQNLVHTFQKNAHFLAQLFSSTQFEKTIFLIEGDGNSQASQT